MKKLAAYNMSVKKPVIHNLTLLISGAITCAVPYAYAEVTDSYVGVGQEVTSVNERSAQGENSVTPSGGTLTEAIIGDDNRKQIQNTRAYPFSTVGFLDTKNGWCTGTLIGPRHVLTSAYCVYDINTNQWRDGVRFIPGLNGDEAPFGMIGVSNMVVVKGYSRDHDPSYNFAMVILDKAVGYQTGWLGFGHDPNLPNHIVNSIGYPVDRAEGTMWFTSCQIKDVQSQFLTHDCDAVGGNNGSPVYAYFPDGNKRIIYGITTGENSNANIALRINEFVFNKLKTWLLKY